MNTRRPIVILFAISGMAAVLASVLAAPSRCNADTRKPVVAPPSLTKLGPSLVPALLPDGRLIGVFDRTGKDGPEAASVYSSDDGRTWSQPETLCKLPKETGGWGLHNVLVDHKGELHLFYTNDAHTSGKGLYEMRFDVYHVGSTNGRKTWKAPVLARKGYNGSMLSVIQLKSGRIVLPVCYLTPRVWSNRGTGFDAFTDMGRFSSGVVYSDDGGDSWKQSAIEFKVPSPYIGADGMIEPIALELKDGRVWMLIRTQLGRFFESFSEDGSVWTRPRPTSIISSDSPPSLTRLKDGRIVMLWNNSLRFSYAQGGRHLLHAAISEDEGRTWRGCREVARNPLIDEPPPPNGDHGVAYTLPSRTQDGQIVTPLSVGGTGGMWWLRFDPEWLYEDSRKSDFTSDTDSWNHFGTKGVAVIAHPERPSARALQLRKTNADWPAGVVWNFPSSTSGRLQMSIKVMPGFGGARIGLTDHFSVPFDPEDSIYNLFNLSIGSEGKLKGGEIRPGEWHTVQLDWNCAKLECKVSVDGRPVETLPMQRRTAGVNYLRLTSTAEDTDTAGMLIESVEASASP